MGQLYAMKKMIEDLQGQKVTPNLSVVTESLMEGLSCLSNANLTKSKIMKTITENQYIPSTLPTQSSSNNKELYSTRLEMERNCIDLTENNNSEPSS